MVCSMRRVIDSVSHGPVAWTNPKAQLLIVTCSQDWWSWLLVSWLCVLSLDARSLRRSNLILAASDPNLRRYK